MARRIAIITKCKFQDMDMISIEINGDISTGFIIGKSNITDLFQELKRLQGIGYEIIYK